MCKCLYLLPDAFQMKEIFQSIFSNTQERIKNPFIGAFMTSWFAINWRPISVFLFSTKSIEQKITYIELHHIDWHFTFLYPLATSVGYVLILPHINLLFETLLGYAGSQRNKILMKKQEQARQNKLQIALGDIKLEEAKTEYRERNSHNQLVEDLQKRLAGTELMLTEERSSNNQTIKDLQTQLHDSTQLLAEERTEMSKATNEAIIEVNRLRAEIDESHELVKEHKVALDRRTMTLTNQLDERNKYVKQLENEIDGLRLKTAEIQEEYKISQIDADLSEQKQVLEKRILEGKLESLRKKYGIGVKDINT